MSKDKQERVCFENLYSNVGGKYVARRLGFLKKAVVVESWDESPDFLVLEDGKAIGIEHFLFDQTYIENRAGSRVKDEETWEVYEKHHEALEKGSYNSDVAAKDIEIIFQDTFDIATYFDFDICMNHFGRIFDNHVGKISKYKVNLNMYEKTELYFLVEVSSLFFSEHRKVIKCLARRPDNALVQVSGNHIIFTDFMIEKIKKQIGVLQGVIFQNYSYYDLDKRIKDMVYLDTTSIEAFEKSLKAQKIQVYKEYFIDVPKIQTKLNLVK